MISYAENGAPYPTLVRHMHTYEYEIQGRNLEIRFADEVPGLATTNVHLRIVETEDSGYVWIFKKNGEELPQMEPCIHTLHQMISIFLPAPCDLAKLGEQLALELNTAISQALRHPTLDPGPQIWASLLDMARTASADVLYIPGEQTSVGHHYRRIIDALLSWPYPSAH